MVEGPLRGLRNLPWNSTWDKMAFMPLIGLRPPFCDNLKEMIQVVYQEPDPFCRVLIDGDRYAVNVIEGFNCGLILYTCSFVVYSRSIIIFNTQL